MIVQKKSSDRRTVKAAYGAKPPYASPFCMPEMHNLAHVHLLNHRNSTVNFGDQSPRENATATAVKVHDYTAGEHSQRRQRISHHWRGIDFSLTEAQSIELTTTFLVKKSYLITLKRNRLKIMTAA